MRRSIFGIGIVLVLFSLLAASAGARLRSGVTGTVVRASNRPTCSENQCSTVAAPGTTLTFLRGTAVVGHVVTAAGGTYTIDLGPGRYTVRASVGSSLRKVTPSTVMVADAAMVHRQFLVAPRVQVQAGTGRSTQ